MIHDALSRFQTRLAANPPVGTPCQHVSPSVCVQVGSMKCEGREQKKTAAPAAGLPTDIRRVFPTLSVGQLGIPKYRQSGKVGMASIDKCRPILYRSYFMRKCCKMLPNATVSVSKKCPSEFRCALSIVQWAAASTFLTL